MMYRHARHVARYRRQRRRDEAQCAAPCAEVHTRAAIIRDRRQKRRRFTSVAATFNRLSRASANENKAPPLFFCGYAAHYQRAACVAHNVAAAEMQALMPATIPSDVPPDFDYMRLSRDSTPRRRARHV